MKSFAFSSAFCFILIAIDARNVPFKESKRQLTNAVQKKQLNGEHCCGQDTTSLSCCQAPNPPPCCHNVQQSIGTFIPPIPPPNASPLQTSPPIHPPPGPSCCPTPPVGNCCNSPQPPPCCSRVPDFMTLQGCCTTVQPPPDHNSCCYEPNPPPCCINLSLKIGDNKNVSLCNGGMNYILNIQLLQGTTNCTAPTKPSSSTPGPTRGSTGGATSGTTKASSGPTKPGSGPTTASSGPTNSSSGPTTPGSVSTQPTSGPTTSLQQDCRKKALDLHNAKRAIHNSPPMTLDPELNRVAQEYADKLAASKEVKHSNNVDRPGEGENLAKKCVTLNDVNGFPCENAVRLWYNEVHNYDFGSARYSSDTGHFTQVVWKGTRKLGIGKASYISSEGLKCYVIVGRYKAAGNVQGEFETNVERGSFVGV